MINILRRVYVIGYLLYVAPPRAIEILRNHQLRNGELSGWSPSFTVILEGALRAILLLMIAACTEVTIGAYWYEVLKLDIVFGVILISGLLHTIFYMCFFLYSSFSISRRSVLYRFGRNFGYSFLPGLPVLVLLLFINEVSFEINFAQDTILHVYLGILGVSLLAGVIEATLVNRRPLGLVEGPENLVR